MYPYRTASDTGEPPSTATSPLVFLESHQAPLRTFRDTGEPLGNSTSPLETLESHNVPLPHL